MAILKKWAEEGLIKGIPLTDFGSKQLLFQVFADDIGMFLETSKANFVAAKEALSLYERISRGKLNMEKSTLVPIDDHPPPAWLADTGCRVARPKEIIKYLGSPIGV